MSADFDYVVYTSLNTDVAISVFRCGISCEIHVRDRIPISLIASRIFVDCAHLARPGMADNQETTFAGTNRIAALVNYISFDARQRTCSAARFKWQDDRGANQNHACFRLPPCIHNRQLITPNMLAIPHPGFWINWLTHATKQTETGQVMFGGPLFAEAHKSTNGRRCCVQDTHLVLLYHAPETVGGWIRWHAFKLYAGRAIHQRTIDHIAMTCHPTDISCTPVDIAGLNIKNKLGRRINTNSVATLHVDNTFRLACAPTGIEDVEHILAIHWYTGHHCILRDIGQQFVQIDITSGLHVDISAQATYDNSFFYRGCLSERLIRDLFQLD